MEDSQLKQVVALAHRQVALQQEVERAEETLARRKAALRQISEVDIPELFAEIGIRELKLPDGMKVSVAPEVQCSIPPDSKMEAYNWLESGGFGGIIKTDVVIEFGKGELTKAQSLAAKLRKHYPTANWQRYVHPQTLKAFVKEQLGAGRDLPAALFGVTMYSKTTIK